MENETKTDITDGQVQPPEEETTQTYKPQWRPQDADREYIKITTRKRIRETVAHPNAIFKPAKPAPNINSKSFLISLVLKYNLDPTCVYSCKGVYSKKLNAVIVSLDESNLDLYNIIEPQRQ